MRLIIRRIIAFYLDAFFVLFILGVLFLIIYVIDNSIDLSILRIPLEGYYFLVYLLYYLLSEYFFQQTIAKKIVNIEVIFERKSLSFILLRTFCRFIPFDAISFLFNSQNILWHDLLSKTRVVSSTLSPERDKK